MNQAKIREINTLVAEKVLGWKLSPLVGEEYTSNFRPCEDVESAMELLRWFEVVEMSRSGRDGFWTVGLTDSKLSFAASTSKSLPLAICIAALETKGIIVDQES